LSIETPAKYSLLYLVRLVKIFRKSKDFHKITNLQAILPMEAI